MGCSFGGRSHNADLTVSGRVLAGVSSSQENGKVWSVASTVRFRVDRKDDGGIVICEAQNQALPSGHSKQTQYVLDVQCKCLAGRHPGEGVYHPPPRLSPGEFLVCMMTRTTTLSSHFCPQTPPRPGSMPPKL